MMVIGILGWVEVSLSLLMPMQELGRREREFDEA